MRRKLAEIDGERATFTGVFVRTGVKNSYKGTLYTILLKNIKDDYGDIVADHLWFNLTKGFQQLQLILGDIVQFEARVEQYRKGYKGYKDYKLSRPTKIKKIGRVNDWQERQALLDLW